MQAPALETVAMWGGLLTAMAGGVAAVWRVTRAVARTGRRVDDFMDDWYGEAARPGVPARPGVLERVGGIEDRLERVEHQLHPNEGASLRDAVDRANRSLGRLCPGCDDPGHPAGD